MKQIKLSRQTMVNWLIDAAVFASAVTAALSGIYFLYFTSGGYQGGRNPLYGVTVLFGRHTWDDIHTWGGALMIAAVLVHLAIHWRWITMMARRAIMILRGQRVNFSHGAKVNVAIDLAIALAFLLVAISGVYFLFAPTGGFQGGANPGWDPGFLFSRSTWDIIHTWSGVVLIISALLHFAIHWRWVVNVTRRFALSLARPRRLAPGINL